MRWNERLATWSERHVLTVDALGVLAVWLLAAVVTGVFGLALDPYDRASSLRSISAGTLAALVLVAPLAWRRVRPVGSCAAVYTIAAALLLARPTLLPAVAVVVPVVLYSVTVHAPAWAYRAATAVAFAAVPVAALRLATHAERGETELELAASLTVFAWLVLAAVWAFALLRRSRRERLDALRDRAERLEVERDQQTRLAAAAERARIARELHDIVAHSLSVMIAQADGGRYAAPRDPDAAVRSLETVAETGRAALADMRRLLGVLRTETGGSPTAPGPAGPGTRAGGAAATYGAPATGASGAGTSGAGTTGPGPGAGTASSSAPRAPQPGVEGLDALVEQVRATGVRVSLVRVGTPRRLPPGAGLTVFRVAQEALTNVLKHAGPGPSVTVVLRWAADDLVLSVDDDGRGAASDGDGSPGYGILGMHERAAVFGGTVAAGPRPGGGFAVRLVLPLRYASAAEPAPEESAPVEPAPVESAGR